MPKRRLPPLTEIALPLLALLSALMLALAVPNIIGTGGWWTYAKAGVLAASAMVVSFAVNRLAIERGAPAATRGHLGAVAVSLGSMLAVGSGLFAATYSGLVFKDVAELQLQEHGTALASMSDATEAAAKAGRLAGNPHDRERSCTEGTRSRPPASRAWRRLWAGRPDRWRTGRTGGGDRRRDRVGDVSRESFSGAPTGCSSNTRACSAMRTRTSGSAARRPPDDRRIDPAGFGGTR
ncbi:MAG: hypothetical protein M9905_06100 [Rhizobiaceae bacterium]|nr:hypothetical protein [Rhizobiaceae bacterium]